MIKREDIFQINRLNNYGRNIIIISSMFKIMNKITFGYFQSNLCSSFEIIALKLIQRIVK